MIIYFFVVVVTLLSTGNAQDAADASQQFGYLVADQSDDFTCVKPPSNDLCNLDYEIMRFSGPLGAQMVDFMFSAVELTITVLTKATPGYSKECLKDMRQYVCLNTFARCTNRNGNVGVSFNPTEAEKACHAAMNSCPKEAVGYLTYNCTYSNRHFLDWAV